MSLAYEMDVDLGQVIFGHAQLGDRRRTSRFVATFNRMRRHPGGTLPDKLPSPADLRAFYRLGDMNPAQLPNDVAACQTILVQQDRKIHELQYANVEQARAITE